MPSINQDRLFHQAEQSVRNAMITREDIIVNLPNVRNITFEDAEMPIAHAHSHDPIFKLDDNGEFSATLTGSFIGRDRESSKVTTKFFEKRVGHRAQTATDVIRTLISTYMHDLDANWETLEEDYELSDEEEYVTTDPISFDELMGTV